MGKILVLEDDYMLNSGICYNLEMEDHEVLPVYTISEAISAVKEQSFDLFLLDVNLPDGTGYDFCVFLRKHTNAPVIFLTARDLAEEMLKGYDLGADDYVPKPFNIQILLKKIAVLLMRAKGGQATEDIYTTGNVTINFNKMLMVVDNIEIPFTAMEYKILKIFTDNAGNVLTRKMLLERLWDTDENYVDEHTLTVTINRLRKKLGVADCELIKTVYGMGYLWNGVKR